MEAALARGEAIGWDSPELAMIYRIAAAAERRDGETHAHTLRVGRGAALLAAESGMTRSEVHLVRLAAPLHDIGKLGVSDTILSKPAPLNTHERDEMRTHTDIGRRMLEGSESPVLRLGALIAFTHHECWDGSGYPMGAAGLEIPVAGRVTAIADAFDSMTHDRPYKDAWSVEEALGELELMSGEQFDPILVEAFQRLDHEDLLTLAD
jgi:putative two-component system response regulator